MENETNEGEVDVDEVSILPKKSSRMFILKFLPFCLIFPKLHLPSLALIYLC